MQLLQTYICLILMHKFTMKCQKKHAYYQRYSDDIIIVCDQENETFFYNLLRSEIEEKAYLEIQTIKTNIYRYVIGDDNTLVGGIVKDSVVNLNKQLEYLGFNFDGKKVRVKTSGFSKFYRNMKHSFKRGIYFAKQAHIPSNSLFEGRLYKLFTHIGAKRRLKWLPDATSLQDIDEQPSMIGVILLVT